MGRIPLYFGHYLGMIIIKIPRKSFWYIIWKYYLRYHLSKNLENTWKYDLYRYNHHLYRNFKFIIFHFPSVLFPLAEGPRLGLDLTLFTPRMLHFKLLRKWGHGWEGTVLELLLRKDYKTWVRREWIRVGVSPHVNLPLVYT